MNLQECYEMIEGNYADAKSRLMSDRLVDKFLIKFKADPTMNELREAVKEGKIEESFRASHTLKGVAANLSLTKLQMAASDLTEQLRSKSEVADAALVSKVEEAYLQTIQGIEQYEKEK